MRTVLTALFFVLLVQEVQAQETEPFVDFITLAPEAFVDPLTLWQEEEDEDTITVTAVRRGPPLMVYIPSVAIDYSTVIEDQALPLWRFNNGMVLQIQDEGKIGLLIAY